MICTLCKNLGPDESKSLDKGLPSNKSQMPPLLGAMETQEGRLWAIIGMFPLMRISGNRVPPIMIPIQDCKYKGGHPKALRLNTDYHRSTLPRPGDPPLPERFRVLRSKEGLGFRV